MAVIHIFKDGSTKEELNDVYVPQDLVEKVVSIVKGKKKGEKKTNEKTQ